jgi:DNA-directed RNA polymerase specialized sigma24 family protein
MDITLSHNSTDDELLAAVARGDRVAFAELYDRFAPHVLARVTSEVADTRQALDTVADVFVEFTAPFAHDGLAEGALAS